MRGAVRPGMSVCFFLCLPACLRVHPHPIQETAYSVQAGQRQRRRRPRGVCKIRVNRRHSRSLTLCRSIFLSPSLDAFGTDADLDIPASTGCDDRCLSVPRPQPSCHWTGCDDRLNTVRMWYAMPDRDLCACMPPTLRTQAWDLSPFSPGQQATKPHTRTPTSRIWAPLPCGNLPFYASSNAPSCQRP